VRNETPTRARTRRRPGAKARTQARTQARTPLDKIIEAAERVPGGDPAWLQWLRDLRDKDEWGEGQRRRLTAR
jgi:hypothetical protein